MYGSRRLLAARVAEWAALAGIPILTALRTHFPAPQTPTDLAQFLLLTLHANYAGAVVALALMGLVGRVAQHLLGAERKNRIKAVLDTLDEALFRDVPGEARYQNRATLFRANYRQTRLKLYCRAGTWYQAARPQLAIDGNNEQRNQGVGGQAWFRNTMLDVWDLPDCPVPCVATNQTCVDYAARGFMDLERTAKLHVRSRSLLAVVVRDSAGRKWGALCVDRRDPLRFSAEQRALTSAFATAIGKMV